VIFAAVFTWILLFAACGWYTPLIVRGKVQPPPATWILAAAGINIAAVAALNVPNRTLIENVTLYAAAVEIDIVFTVLAVYLSRRGQWRSSLNTFQWTCLGVMVVSVLRWIFGSGGPKETFWILQTLFVLAYVVTAVKALQVRWVFDSIVNWLLICSAAVAGLVPAILKESPYGIFNSVRAIVSAGFLVWFFVSLDRKDGWKALSREAATNKEFYTDVWRRIW